MNNLPRLWTASVVVALSVASFAPHAVHAADAADADRAISSYVEAVRAALEHGKRAPTGREVSLTQPTGRTEVTFWLARSGKVTAAKTTQSSYATAIDDQARQLVRRARYPAFPASAWAGSPTHTFVVTYDFTRGPKGRVEISEPVEVKAQ